LPGKVMADLAGRPMLVQQIHRLQRCRAVDEILIATTTNAADEPIVEAGRTTGIGWYRGSEADVLGRYVGAAHQARADVVIRITADCPLIDPDVVDHVIGELTTHATACDYASNVLRRTYPRGLDAEALFSDVLARIDRLTTSAAAREHVTILPRTERPDLFLRRSIEDDEDNSDLRWTVDTPADMMAMRTIYQALHLGERVIPYREMVAYVRAHPELASINAGVETWEPRRAPGSPQPSTLQERG